MRSAIVRNPIFQRVRGRCLSLRTVRTRTMGPSSSSSTSANLFFPPSNYIYNYSYSSFSPFGASRCKSTLITDTDQQHNHNTAPTTTSASQVQIPRVRRTPVVPYPLSEHKTVPAHIPYPPYAVLGYVPDPPDQIVLHDAHSIAQMRAAARLARQCLDVACGMAVRAHERNWTTDDIDTAVHQAIVAAGAYPSPLLYAGFPKSMCTSINEVICHGIPDQRPLQFGDVVSFDVSCYLNGVHGDNCATVIVGDCPDDYEYNNNNDNNNNNNDPTQDPYFVAARRSPDNDRTNTPPDPNCCDWRGIPYRTHFCTPDCEAHFVQARKLVRAARECLYAAIATVRPQACLTEIGRACDTVADRYGYQSVRKYRGHGIGRDFHTPPFVKHYTNLDFCPLKPGMIFTIEPMIVVGNEACFEWPHDQWTVATVDGSLAAQFEHTVLVTPEGVEILTLP